MRHTTNPLFQLKNSLSCMKTVNLIQGTLLSKVKKSSATWSDFSMAQQTAGENVLRLSVETRDTPENRALPGGERSLGRHEAARREGSLIRGEQTVRASMIEAATRMQGKRKKKPDPGATTETTNDWYAQFQMGTRKTIAFKNRALRLVYYNLFWDMWCKNKNREETKVMEIGTCLAWRGGGEGTCMVSTEWWSRQSPIRTSLCTIIDCALQIIWGRSRKDTSQFPSHALFFSTDFSLGIRFWSLNLSLPSILVTVTRTERVFSLEEEPTPNTIRAVPVAEVRTVNSPINS